MYCNQKSYKINCTYSSKVHYSCKPIRIFATVITIFTMYVLNPLFQVIFLRFLKFRPICRYASFVTPTFFSQSIFEVRNIFKKIGKKAKLCQRTSESLWLAKRKNSHDNQNYSTNQNSAPSLKFLYCYMIYVRTIFGREKNVESTPASKWMLAPLRQARETYVCVNLLRKLNISIDYYLESKFKTLFLTKIILKKL